MDETVYITFRAPKSLREQVRKAAKADGRSYSNYLRWLVEQGAKVTLRKTKRGT